MFQVDGSHGSHDDQVDAWSQCMNWLRSRQAPPPAPGARSSNGADHGALPVLQRAQRRLAHQELGPLCRECRKGNIVPRTQFHNYWLTRFTHGRDHRDGKGDMGMTPAENSKLTPHCARLPLLRDKNSYRKDNPAEYTKASLPGRRARPASYSQMGSRRARAGRAARARADPPVGDKLRWAPPALTNPVSFDLTNATRTSTHSRQRPGPRSRAHLHAKSSTAGWGCSRAGGTSSGSGARWSTSRAPVLAGMSSRRATRARCTSRGSRRTVAGDFFGCRFTNPIIQIEACDISVTDLGTSAHADCLPDAVPHLRRAALRHGTFTTDYQGFFCSNEPQYAGQPCPRSWASSCSRSWNFKRSGSASPRPILQGHPLAHEHPAGAVDAR